MLKNKTLPNSRHWSNRIVFKQGRRGVREVLLVVDEEKPVAVGSSGIAGTPLCSGMGCKSFMKAVSFIPEQKLKSNHSNAEPHFIKKVWTSMEPMFWHWAKDNSFNCGGFCIVYKWRRIVLSTKGDPFRRKTCKC